MPHAKTLLKRVGLYEPARASFLWLKRPDWWKQRRARRRFYAGLVPRGSLCFDVGANEGEYTADLLSIGASRVVAVEPQSACVGELRRQFAGDRRVVLEPVAVGAAEGTVTLYASAASAIGSCSREWVDAVKSSGRFPGQDWEDAAEVPMTTLDRLIATHGRPAFCKIDVEGFELDVLRGLSSPIPFLSFEYSPETLDCTRDCVAHLSLLGDYRFNYCAHGHYTFALPQPLAADPFQRVLRELPPHATKWGGDVYAWCGT